METGTLLTNDNVFADTFAQSSIHRRRHSLPMCTRRRTMWTGHALPPTRRIHTHRPTGVHYLLCVNDSCRCRCTHQRHMACTTHALTITHTYSTGCQWRTGVLDADIGMSCVPSQPGMSAMQAEQPGTVLGWMVHIVAATGTHTVMLNKHVT